MPSRFPKGFENGSRAGSPCNAQIAHNVRIRQGRRCAFQLAEATEHTLHASLESIAISSNTATTHLDLGSLQVGPSCHGRLGGCGIAATAQPKATTDPKTPKGLLPHPYKGLSKLTAHFTNQGQPISPSFRYWLAAVPRAAVRVQEKNAQIRYCARAARYSMNQSRRKVPEFTRRNKLESE